MGVVRGSWRGIVETEHDMVESLGPVLTRVRLARGWSQLRVAELLCAASGTPTVTRHELSRWEREERIPSGHWLGWLALVLDVPVEMLTAAASRTRRGRGPARAPGPAWARLDRKATTAEPAGLPSRAADG